MTSGPSENEETWDWSFWKDFCEQKLFVLKKIHEVRFLNSTRVMLTQLIKMRIFTMQFGFFLSPFKSLVVQQPELNMLCQSYLLHFPGVFFSERATTLSSF